MYEQENNNRIPFLDALFISDYKKINTTVFRKNTHIGTLVDYSTNYLETRDSENIN